MICVLNSELVVPEKILKTHRFTLNRFYLALVMSVALHLFILRNIEVGPIALKERWRKNCQWSNIIFYFSAIPTRRKGDKEVQFDTPFSKRYCVPCSADIRWLRRNLYKFYYFTFISPWRRPDSSLQELNMISSHYECFVPRYTETGPVVLEKCIKDIILLRFGKGHGLAFDQIYNFL